LFYASIDSQNVSYWHLKAFQSDLKKLMRKIEYKNEDTFCEEKVA